MLMAKATAEGRIARIVKLLPLAEVLRQLLPHQTLVHFMDAHASPLCQLVLERFNLGTDRNFFFFRFIIQIRLI